MVLLTNTLSGQAFILSALTKASWDKRKRELDGGRAKGSMVDYYPRQLGCGGVVMDSSCNHHWLSGIEWSVCVRERYLSAVVPLPMRQGSEKGMKARERVMLWQKKRSRFWMAALGPVNFLSLSKFVEGCHCCLEVLAGWEDCKYQWFGVGCFPWQVKCGCIGFPWQTSMAVCISTGRSWCSYVKKKQQMVSAEILYHVVDKAVYYT